MVVRGDEGCPHFRPGIVRSNALIIECRLSPSSTGILLSAASSTLARTVMGPAVAAYVTGYFCTVTDDRGEATLHQHYKQRADRMYALQVFSLCRIIFFFPGLPPESGRPRKLSSSFVRPKSSEFRFRFDAEWFSSADVCIPSPSAGEAVCVRLPLRRKCYVSKIRRKGNVSKIRRKCYVSKIRRKGNVTKIRRKCNVTKIRRKCYVTKIRRKCYKIKNTAEMIRD